MPNPVLLNNIDHAAMRVIPTRGAAWGDNVMSALTYPDEFRTLQAHYPIVFQQNGEGGSGDFHALALFGFQQGENLFLDDAHGEEVWDAPEIPLSVQRQPFLIGTDGDELMVHVDLDSPRLSREHGEPLFLPQGGNTEYTERMASTLRAIHLGLQGARSFTAALLEHNMLESFFLDVTLDDGSVNRLAGFHTIHEERLAALDGAALDRLHRAGHLQAIYMVLASLSQFRALIDRKNRRNAAGR
jgi:hypothetical protein